MQRIFFIAVAGMLIGLYGGRQMATAEDPSAQNISGTSSKRTENTAGARSVTAFPINPIAIAEKKIETAVFAGGCFWCTEFAFEQLAGVIDVESGYCGGTKSTANYHTVHLGLTSHAEAIRITYDSGKITYDELLDVFFDAHDPTQWNRQGKDDVGRQYRSAIFFANEDQQKQAEAKIADLTVKHVYLRRIATKLEPLKEFYPAENFHQNFVRRNPYLPYIQSHALPRAYNVRIKHPHLIQNGN